MQPVILVFSGVFSYVLCVTYFKLYLFQLSECSFLLRAIAYENGTCSELYLLLVVPKHFQFSCPTNSPNVGTRIFVCLSLIPPQVIPSSLFPYKLRDSGSVVEPHLGLDAT